MKAKSRKQLAADYGICEKTLAKWFKSFNIKVERGLITPKKLIEIYRKIGNPKGGGRIIKSNGFSYNTYPEYQNNIHLSNPDCENSVCIYDEFYYQYQV